MKYIKFFIPHTAGTYIYIYAHIVNFSLINGRSCFYLESAVKNQTSAFNIEKLHVFRTSVWVNHLSTANRHVINQNKSLCSALKAKLQREKKEQLFIHIVTLCDTLRMIWCKICLIYIEVHHRKEEFAQTETEQKVVGVVQDFQVHGQEIFTH